ncbi:hypothetical protein BJ166DRAFT_11466 [Pestalotiopsis sp. NC0098]|nr:hypothetical protein BJ166DRAFT_11466 [Pestalotiopsis sp. NC0098]
MNTTLVFAANSLVMIPLTTLKSFVIEIISFLVGTEMGNPFLINLFGIVLTLVNTIYISVAFNRGKGTGTTGIASAKGFENKHHEEGALELLDLLFGKMTENGVGSDSPIQPSHTALKAMCTPDTTCACDVLRQSSKAKFTTAHFSMLLVTIFFFPSTAAAMAISPGFRVIAGIGASGTAIAVIPFRTLPGVDDKMWIITYIAWAAFYSGYLGMQLLLIPSQMSHRRKGSVSMSLPKILTLSLLSVL